jgi:hypothetical protein
MSQQVDSRTRTFIADAAIAQFARVVFESDGRVVTAGITEVGVGIAQSPAFAAGDAIAVKLWNSDGTFKMIAVEALAVGATLYTEAAGKVQDTAAATSVPFAQALEAATADGDIIECVLLPYSGTAAE